MLLKIVFLIYVETINVEVSLWAPIYIQNNGMFVYGNKQQATVGKDSSQASRP